jgi:hypothetical protein
LLEQENSPFSGDFTIRNSSGTIIDFAGQIPPNRLPYGG